MDKSNTNHIGYFHQNIFKYIHFSSSPSKWVVPKQGFDIVNATDRIYVEMKNKHNTMNSSSSQKTFMRMQNQVLKDAESKCLLVEVIATNSQNIKWAVSLDGNLTSHNNIRRVSIDKFYEMVTGEQDAFKQLVEILPQVMDDVLLLLPTEKFQNAVFAELHSIDSNMLKSLYLLAFKKYAGFNDLVISL